jgi:hypothetical protein
MTQQASLDEWGILSIWAKEETNQLAETHTLVPFSVEMD